ncbi:MAG: ExbD/TolR family protein [Persicimonas sp.]
MSRKRRGVMDEDQEINLAPFMNMVVILIPMLLLSVVFVKIGVINITAPKLSVGGEPEDKKEEDDEEPLNLTVAVSDEGFEIAAKSATMSPLDGCPEQGPTICLEDENVDIGAKFEESREAYDQGNPEAGQKALSEAIEAYDYRRLYNELVEIKEEYPDETVVNLSANSDDPYAVLVKVMDTARYRLDEDSYDDPEEFAAAEPPSGDEEDDQLFSDPVLSVVQ